MIFINNILYTIRMTYNKAKDGFLRILEQLNIVIDLQLKMLRRSEDLRNAACASYKLKRDFNDIYMSFRIPVPAYLSY